MENMRSLIKRETELVEYGVVRVKLAEMLDKRGITRNHLRTLTDLKYGIIDRYYKAQTIAYVDLNFLAKVCFVLDCQISDLLEYQPPAEQTELAEATEPTEPTEPEMPADSKETTEA